MCNKYLYLADGSLFFGRDDRNNRLAGRCEKDRDANQQEDIYPYATFQLPEHEAITRKGLIYETRENTLKSSKSKSAYSVGESDDRYCKGDNWTGTERRNKRLSTKTLKSESEEYDSLNSDSELSGEKRGTEGDNQMAECEYFLFTMWSNLHTFELNLL